MVELLVVILIIALLASILFPVLAQAKEAALANKVLSNMRQIGVAAQLYAADFDDQIVPYRVANPSGQRNLFREDRITWPFLLYPYTKSGLPRAPKGLPGSGPNAYTGIDDPSFRDIPATGVFENPLWTWRKWHDGGARMDCDGTITNPTWDQYTTPLHWAYAGFGISFFQLGPDANTSADSGGPGCIVSNPYYALAGGDGLFNQSMIFTQVVRPDQTALLTDGFVGLTAKDSVASPLGDPNVPLQTGSFGCEGANFYKGGGNLAFMDAHAKFVRGNSERYLDTDASGCVYKHYYTFDR